MRRLHMESKTTVPRGRRVHAWFRGTRVLARGEQGASLVEFALVMPLLFMVMMGIIMFGMGFSSYLSLENGTNVAGQALSISRGQDTPGETIVDPCQTAYLAFHNASPTLNNNYLNFTIQIWKSPSASTTYGPFAGGSGVSCTGGSSLMTSGQEAMVTVTYLIKLNFFGFNFCPANGCTLTAQTSEVVQ